MAKDWTSDAALRGEYGPRVKAAVERDLARRSLAGPSASNPSAARPPITGLREVHNSSPNPSAGNDLGHRESPVNRTHGSKVPAYGQPGSKPGGRRRGTPVEREGWLLDSKAEGLLWDLVRARYPEAALWPHVGFPLLQSSEPGKSVRRFKVDLVARTRVEGSLVLLAFEAKGPAKLDSRDFWLRWGEFLASTGIPGEVYRAARGRLERVQGRVSRETT